MDKFIEIYKGRILPICARPGMGTTALALQIADAYTQNTDKAAVIFSQRLTKEEILDRIVCQRLSLDYYGKVKKNALSEDEQSKFAHEMGQIENSNMQIIENANLTDEDMKQALADSNNIGLVVVDCLDAFEEKVTVHALTEMAERMNIPFIVTCLAKRFADRRISKFPKRRDIKIKELSKVQTVYFLVRKFYYDMNADMTEATLIVDEEKRVKIQLKWSGSDMSYQKNCT